MIKRFISFLRSAPRSLLAKWGSLLKSANRRVYLDYAGATPISARAKRALQVSSELYGNPSAIHKEGVQASQLLDRARTLCAKVLNAHAYEIYFVSSGTESCNLAIMGAYLGAIENWKLEIENSRPHIIVSCIEHPAVLEPIHHLEKQGLVRVTYLPVYENGIVKVKDIRDALCEETILVSVMYANNEIGTIQPVKEIGRAIEEWKKEQEELARTHTSYPYFHIDACQAGNYCNLDVVRLRAHLMTVNSSKVYGPKGVALLYRREGIKIDPIIYGGGQERGLRSGTESVSLAYSFGVALTESQEMKEKESVRLRELRDLFKKEATKQIPGIVFYGAWEAGRQQTTDNRQQKDLNQLPTTHYPLLTTLRLPNNINCRVPGITSEEIILRLDAVGFACSHKSACASRESDGSYVIEALGVSEQESLENIRITLGRETNKYDIDSLVESMKIISEKFSRH